jgi:hypothetical protein
MKDRQAAIGNVASTSEEFGAGIKAELALWARVISGEHQAGGDRARIVGLGRRQDCGHRGGQL